LLVDGIDQEEIAGLKRLLQMRVEELNQEQLGNLIVARQQLSKRAGELVAGLSNARAVLSALDEHLTQMELAAQQAQRSESIRLTLEGFEAIADAVSHMSQQEQAVLQMLTGDPDNSEASTPTNGLQAQPAVEAPVEEPRVSQEVVLSAKVGDALTQAPAPPPVTVVPPPTPALNVFDTALDRLRRTRTGASSPNG
jgi:hypothetical protein